MNMRRHYSKISVVLLLIVLGAITGATFVPQVINGFHTDLFPEVVLLRGVNSRGISMECSGILVSPGKVLTAAHCINDARISSVHFVLRGGLFNISYPTMGAQYSSEADVGLVIYKAGIADPSPASLADVKMMASLPRDVTVVGFGLRDKSDQTSSGDKQEGSVQLLTPDCKGSNSSGKSWSATNNCKPGVEMIAGASPQSTDTCYGDSGGPLYISADGRYYVAGVTSRGTNETTCGEGGIYVRIDAPAVKAILNAH